MFTYLLAGLVGALTPENLLSALLGCFLGTVVGILPGLGPSTTVALLIPVAFAVRPDTMLIMMCGVYLGAMYGGSLTSILLKVPGEASSALTALDGFEMARQGRAGPALAIAAVGSFIGGTLSVVALTVVAQPIARFALRFGPSEYFALMVFALVMSATLIGRSLTRGLLAVVLGVMLSVVGSDLQTGIPRFTLGIDILLDGIDIVVVIIGIFGVAEVLHFLLHESRTLQGRLAIRGRLWLSREDLVRSAGPIGRGTAVGFLAGVMPGSGSTLGSMLAYALEGRVGRARGRLGTGAIEGVAAVETANNAATGGALIPMFTLGIPGSGTTAVLLAVLLMYGVQPGPRLMVEQAQLFWTVVASLYISNVILLILNLPLIPLFVRILDIPARYLMPAIGLFAAVGAYSVNTQVSDVWLVFLFGLLGYAMRWAGMPPVALVLGMVLGDRLEQSLRQAFILGNRSFVFLLRPITLTLLLAAVLVVALDAAGRARARRRAVPTPAPQP
ncbi:MAG: tripartite tricarboxylate transporter permease [Armatimonadota bacterium]|nr:tripartite tricarboxylate transporter permease [Armatimonadota bacterium]MDR7402920.1 tripartite tricarboxylate transporter permease [Armatimonadota bacterium]MDR7437986.1 tripartite tricarboxylate transporter permease [Armatimonadota bacterium]MDR7473068.1 tripartite tricarboxylate transporter permease [Armatimonadota bacterium]MDR7507396.1 tripartite tricarboxylate transporter permease [Armatimonadota bacterium]